MKHRIGLGIGVLLVLLIGAVFVCQAHGAPPNATGNDALLMQRVVFAEAAGESLDGKVHVAAVILNRVEQRGFPNTITGVIHQKNAFASVTEGSPLWRLSASPGKMTRQQQIAWNDSGKAVRMALERRPDDDIIAFRSRGTAGERYFSKLRLVTTVGGHRFYANRT